MIFLCCFQFRLRASIGVTAIAAVIFIIFLTGLFSIAGLACFYRLRFGKYEAGKDRLIIERKTFWKKCPGVKVFRESEQAEKDQGGTIFFSIPWMMIRYIDDDPNRLTVHEDEEYIVKYGWLSARFRRTKWWFFSAWLFYELLRACFYGGAQNHPRTQLVGLLMIEVLAFIGLICTKPFESRRLNAVMVYMLSISKIATLAISVCFDPRYVSHLPGI
jgi:Transient receptor potential (TRP) ion channel